MTSKKYSVSLPEQLAEAVRKRVGPGEFSAYVAEALEHRVAMDKLGEYVDDYVKNHGPLSEEEIAVAMAELSHHSIESPGATA